MLLKIDSLLFDNADCDNSDDCDMSRVMVTATATAPTHLAKNKRHKKAAYAATSPATEGSSSNERVNRREINYDKAHTHTHTHASRSKVERDRHLPL